MNTLTRRLALPALVALAALAGCEADPPFTSTAESEAVFDDALSAESFDGDARVPNADFAFASAPSSPLSTSETASPSAPDRPAPDAAALWGRHLRRSAELRVATPDYGATLSKARAVAGRYGGLVTGEDGTSGDGYDQTTLTLRVPSARFDGALDALAALGDVESRQVSVDDQTGQVVDLDARLRAKRVTEARTLALVGQAGGTQVAELERQLDGVRTEIEVMESHARAKRGAVALSTFRATFVGTAPAPAPQGLWAGAVGAVGAGWVGFWTVVIGVLPLWPLALLAGAGFAVWRRLAPRLAA